MAQECLCCANARTELLYEVTGVPANSCILLNSRTEALNYPRGDIRLEYCGSCGYIANTLFDSGLTEYSARYEETQAFSVTFNTFQENLAKALVENHDIKHKRILEIGCGKGEFLGLLCEIGENRGLGYDPSYSPARGDVLSNNRFRVIQEFFPKSYPYDKVDLVCSKMTLEHIATPYVFLKAAKTAVRSPGGILFIQVPDTRRILLEDAFQDIYYEHCSYFTSESLTRLLQLLGFRVLSTKAVYDDQYLTVEAELQQEEVRSCLQDYDDLSVIRKSLTGFRLRIMQRIARWAERLERWNRAGKRVAIWGSGSKGCAFLHAVPGAEAVEFAVDVNPYRKDHYMPGSGTKIVGPEKLRESPPEVIVVMNRVYISEIRQQLDRLELSVELLAL